MFHSVPSAVCNNNPPSCAVTTTCPDTVCSLPSWRNVTCSNAPTELGVQSAIKKTTTASRMGKWSRGGGNRRDELPIYCNHSTAKYPQAIAAYGEILRATFRGQILSA